MAGTYHSPPNQKKEDVDEASSFNYRCPHTYRLLLENISQPDVCWKSGTESCELSRRLLEHGEDNVLIPVKESLTRGKARLDLFLPTKIN